MTHVGSACAMATMGVFKTTKAKATLSKLEATDLQIAGEQHGAIGMVGIMYIYIYFVTLKVINFYATLTTPGHI